MDVPRSTESTIGGRRSSSWRVFLVGCRKATPGRRTDLSLLGQSARGKSCGPEVLGFGRAEVDEALEAAGLSE
jgi:hypothetical protein